MNTALRHNLMKMTRGSGAYAGSPREGHRQGATAGGPQPVGTALSVRHGLPTGSRGSYATYKV